MGGGEGECSAEVIGVDCRELTEFDAGVLEPPERDQGSGTNRGRRCVLHEANPESQLILVLAASYPGESRDE